MAQPYDQYMAEHGLQSTLDEQRRNFTYEAAKGKYESGGGVAGQSSGGGGGGGASYDEILKAAIKAQQEANQPAVASMQASIPTTQKLYEQQGQYLQSQVQPMEQRYQSLLNSINFPLLRSHPIQTCSRSFHSRRRWKRRNRSPPSAASPWRWFNTAILSRAAARRSSSPGMVSAGASVQSERTAKRRSPSEFAK